MRRFCVLLASVSALLAASGSALAPAAAADVETLIEGTDLSIILPDDWEVRPKVMSAEEIRAFVSAFPSFASQVGLDVADSDAQLLQTWKRITEDFVLVAFDPRDGDTVTIASHTGDSFWSSFASWRRDQRAKSRKVPGKIVSLHETTVGTHPAFTSIIKTNDYGLLIGTEAIEQSDGSFVIVSATLDPEDRRLTQQILASVKAA